MYDETQFAPADETIEPLQPNLEGESFEDDEDWDEEDEAEFEEDFEEDLEEAEAADEDFED